MKKTLKKTYEENFGVAVLVLWLVFSYLELERIQFKEHQLRMTIQIICFLGTFRKSSALLSYTSSQKMQEQL